MTAAPDRAFSIGRPADDADFDAHEQVYGDGTPGVRLGRPNTAARSRAPLYAGLVAAGFVAGLLVSLALAPAGDRFDAALCAPFEAVVPPWVPAFAGTSGEGTR